MNLKYVKTVHNFKGTTIDGENVYGNYRVCDEMPNRHEIGHFISSCIHNEYQVLPNSVVSFTGLFDIDKQPAYYGDTISWIKSDGGTEGHSLKRMSFFIFIGIFILICYLKYPKNLDSSLTTNFHKLLSLNKLIFSSKMG